MPALWNVPHPSLDPLCKGERFSSIQEHFDGVNISGRHGQFPRMGDSLTYLQSAQIVLHIEREMSLHLDYCQQFGLFRPDIEKQKQSQSTHLR